MSIKLTDEQKKQIKAAIHDYYLNERDEEIGHSQINEMFKHAAQ